MAMSRIQYIQIFVFTKKAPVLQLTINVVQKMFCICRRTAGIILCAVFDSYWFGDNVISYQFSNVEHEAFVAAQTKYQITSTGSCRLSHL